MSIKEQYRFHFIPKRYYEQWTESDFWKGELYTYGFREEKNIERIDIDTLTSFNIKKMHNIEPEFDLKFIEFIKRFEKETLAFEAEASKNIRKYFGKPDNTEYGQWFDEMKYIPLPVPKSNGQYNKLLDLFLFHYIRESHARDMTFVNIDSHDKKKRMNFNNQAIFLLQIMQLSSYFKFGNFREESSELLQEYFSKTPREIKDKISDREFKKFLDKYDGSFSRRMSEFYDMDMHVLESFYGGLYIPSVRELSFKMKEGQKNKYFIFNATPHFTIILSGRIKWLKVYAKGKYPDVPLFVYSSMANWNFSHDEVRGTYFRASEYLFHHEIDPLKATHFECEGNDMRTVISLFEHLDEEFKQTKKK